MLSAYSSFKYLWYIYQKNITFVIKMLGIGLFFLLVQSMYGYAERFTTILEKALFSNLNLNSDRVSWHVYKCVISRWLNSKLEKQNKHLQ